MFYTSAHLGFISSLIKKSVKQQQTGRLTMDAGRLKMYRAHNMELLASSGLASRRSQDTANPTLICRVTKGRILDMNVVTLGRILNT